MLFALNRTVNQNRALIFVLANAILSISFKDIIILCYYIYTETCITPFKT